MKEQEGGGGSPRGRAAIQVTDGGWSRGMETREGSS